MTFQDVPIVFDESLDDNHGALRQLAFKLNRVSDGDFVKLDRLEIDLMDCLERDESGYFRPFGDTDSPVRSGCDYAAAIAERAQRT